MSEKEMANAQGETRLYELALNFVPTLENKIEAAFENIKKLITNEGGVVTIDSKPALIELAYTMGKNIDSKWYRYNTAYFGWVKFTAEAPVLETLKEELDVHADVLRYMILKTTADAATSAQDVAQAIAGGKDTEVAVAEEGEVIADVIAEDEAEPVLEEGISDIESKIDEAIDELVESEE